MVLLCTIPAAPRLSSIGGVPRIEHPKRNTRDDPECLSWSINVILVIRLHHDSSYKLNSQEVEYFHSNHQDSESLKTLIGSLSDYDIFLGVHGAQLTNVLYGKEGLVLVEFTSAFWDKVR